MSLTIALTFEGNDAIAQSYQGRPSQSLKLIPQADGSTGIRNEYHGTVLNLSEGGAWVSPYAGTGSQSFRLILQADGSYTIQNSYSHLALTMTANTLQARPLVAGNRNQRFDVVNQADGSVGLRKVSRSLFSGTVDQLTSIKRVGNWFFNSIRQSTGFYLPKNTPLTLELSVSGSVWASQPKLWIGAQFADPDTRFSTPRAYPLNEGVNSITDAGGGMIYLELSGETNIANLTFTGGAVEVPLFEHLKTTPEQYRDMLRTWTSAPFAELTSARSVVTVSRTAALAHQNNNQNTLMETYERIISVEEGILGLDGSNALHTRAPLKYHLVLGNYGGWGYAHAGHGYTSYHENFAKEMLTPKELEASWGVAHELGHQNQMLGYLPNDFNEVTTNIHSLAVQRHFRLRSTLLGKDSSGRDVWDNALQKLTIPGLKIDDLDLYERLAALEQLRLAFGEQFWPRMNKVTREKWASNGYHPDRQIAFNNLALFASIAAQADLREYFAAWGMPLSAAGSEAIRALNLHPPAVKPQTLREPRSLEEFEPLPPPLTGCTCIEPHPKEPE